MNATKGIESKWKRRKAKVEKEIIFPKLLYRKR
ncbi:MAG: hypothetical protein MRERV_1c084 [Mycoplasmataceae bacterium RV_VA103A]|nr:MAG: hypothetical protein MRERV_10c027 [Mycoplasmataceae bacterium RV_VA103A]KLL05403.1 MAG: hypothetical protein MRERV_1c084 [Mycoplasmataceae bacterium RV_VA103A]